MPSGRYTVRTKGFKYYASRPNENNPPLKGVIKVLERSPFVRVITIRRIYRAKQTATNKNASHAPTPAMGLMATLLLNVIT